MKRTIRTSVCLFLAAILLAAMGVSGLAEQETVSEGTEEMLSTANMPASFQARSMATDELDDFRYWLYTPENPTENMPLIVYLHGASGRGEDLNLVVADADFPKYLRSGELGNVPAYVLIPQLPSEMRGWSEISDSLYSLIEKTIDEFSLDVSVLKEIPVRTFVGSADTVIAPNSAEQMIMELKKAGADAEIVVFDGADHVSVPSFVYCDESIHLVEWLIGAAE